MEVYLPSLVTLICHYPPKHGPRQCIAGEPAGLIVQFARAACECCKSRAWRVIIQGPVVN